MNSSFDWLPEREREREREREEERERITLGRREIPECGGAA